MFGSIFSVVAASAALSQSTGDKVGKDKIETLKRFGLLPLDERDRILSSGVKNLAELPNYQLASAAQLKAHRLFPVVSITSQELEQSLTLSKHNGRDEALEELSRKGRTLAPDEEVSGWWQIEQSNLDRLIANESVLLGVIGGYVKEAATIVEAISRSSYQNRVSLIIKPITGKELEAYRGYIPGVRQGTRYVFPLPQSK